MYKIQFRLIINMKLYPFGSYKFIHPNANAYCQLKHIWRGMEMNEWMMHLYSALLCIAVHLKRFTIMGGGGGFMWGQMVFPINRLHVVEFLSILGNVGIFVTSNLLLYWNNMQNSEVVVEARHIIQ